VIRKAMSDSVRQSRENAENELPLNALSIVIPVYRDAQALCALLRQLRSAREQGAEIVVVGVHNDDSCIDVARLEKCRYIASERGRGIQLAAGATAASGSLLWFLHADVIVPARAAALVCSALAARKWGRFDVRFDNDAMIFQIVAKMMNWRTQKSGIATGDQGIFVCRNVYEAAGGFRLIPLMEDIALSRALRRPEMGGSPARIRHPIIASARKWEREGIIRTIVRMWWWRFRFWWGTNPETLAQEYYREFT
jgi:rSAM/selenodomain-associated transferase 2